MPVGFHDFRLLGPVSIIVALELLWHMPLRLQQTVTEFLLTVITGVLDPIWKLRQIP